MIRVRRILPLLCVAGLAACDLVFTGQDIDVRYDAAADRVDLLLVYHGLTTPRSNDSAIEKGVRAFERLNAGGREFIVLEWPLHFRLDAWADDAAARRSTPHATFIERSIAGDYLQIAERIELVAREAFLDPEGRLCAYQRFRVRDATLVFAALNRMISRQILGSAARGDLHPDDDLDARSIQLLVDQAESGRAWLSLDADGIHVDVPLSDPVLRRLRREVLLELAAERTFVPLAAELLASATWLRFDDERLRARLTPAPGDDRFRWKFESTVRRYDPSLEAALRERGVTPRRELDLDELRAALR